jgi:hypothetical protein
MDTSRLAPISFNQLQYSSDQLFDLYGQLRTLLAAAPVLVSDDTFRQVTDHFNAAHDTLGKCLGRTSGKSSTAVIQAADEERDNLWIGLNGEIEAKLRLMDPNRRAAAQRLHQLITARFDRALYRLSLEENSTALEQFFATLDGSKESQGDLALLGLAIDWYMPLKAAHERFKQILASANASEASRESLPLTREASGRAARKLRLIIDLCEDHAEENHTPYIALHRGIAEIIANVRVKAQAAETREKKKKAAAKAGGLPA